MHPDTPDANTPAVDFDAPATTQDERLASIRALLTQRINAQSQPSHTINQLYAAHQRCADASRCQRELLVRAPRILAVIRRTLSEAFNLDPDHLLFSEPLPPQPVQQVNSLTDRALALFRDPGVPINIHHYTGLSLQGDPGCKLAFNAREAMERVINIGLMARISDAVSGYWQQLAHGSALSRQARWAQLRKAIFADQAFLAQQLFQLSASGYAMTKQLVDAPTAAARQQAGGDWASLRVGRVLWPHAAQGMLEIPGALHLYRSHAMDATQVIYLPGLRREFHEFASLEQLQQALPALIDSALFSVLWQYQPFARRPTVPHRLQPSRVLSADALAHSAQSVLEGQWANEWGCVLSLDYAMPLAPGAQLPSQRAIRLLRVIEKGRKRLTDIMPFESTLDTLLEWDRQRRHAQVVFASLAPDLPLKTREMQLRRYEDGLTVLLDSQAPGQAGDAYQVFCTLQEQRQQWAQRIEQWAQGEDVQLFQKTFWMQRLDATRKRVSLVLNAKLQALRLDARLQQRLGLIKQAHLDRLLEVLDTPLAAARVGSDTRLLKVTVGASETLRYRLMGLFVITTARALAKPGSRQPVLLLLDGAFGGLAVFDTLDDTSAGLRASLGSREGSVLWRCIGRDVRNAARRTLEAPVQVAYSVVEGNGFYEDFKTQLEHFMALEQNLAASPRLFSEVSDPSLARRLLVEELREHLQVPLNDARALAMANVELMRFAQKQVHAQPSWIASATPAQRKTYKRLQNRYLSSALALEERLWQVLPPLQAFARELLIAQLTKDGFYPGVNIDTPFLDMPDDVSSQLCGWSSQCGVGDRSIKKIVSPERTTFSLLELALHNLDPQAPWTEWRLNRANYLQPAWKARMSPSYLIKAFSALDIGGQYIRLIQQLFQSPRSALSRALIDRASEQLAQQQLFSAARQGLSEAAQNLFTTAIKARNSVDLRCNGQHATLGFVRLRGYTLLHDRHISGVLVITDQVSQLCLVYWPTAVGFAVLSEFPHWTQARVALNREGASAQSVKVLSNLVAPGWETEALASYPGYAPSVAKNDTPLINFARKQLPGYGVLSIYEALRRFIRTFDIKHAVAAAEPQVIEAQIKEQIAAAPDGWLDIVSSPHCDALALLAHGRMLEIQHRAHARANTSATLAQYRQQRLGEQWDATVRGLLSFIPVIGVGISVYEMLLAARRFHLSRRPEDAVDVAFITLMTLVDVLTSVLPGAKHAKPGAALGRGALRAGLRHLHRRQALASNALVLPQPLARPLKTLERFKQPFSTDGAVALHGPGEKGVYVKNGEQFVVDGERGYPVYRRRDEHVLRLKNQGGETEGELILYIREDREWLLGADAPPSPQPGPSSGVWRPFVHQPVLDWTPPSQAAIDRVMRNAIVEPTGFESWAVGEHMVLTESVAGRGIYTVNAASSQQSYSVVQHQGRHYRVLPSGLQVSSRELIFITRNQALEHVASLDIAYWLEVGLFDQPRPATFNTTGQWVFHHGLFSESLRMSLVRAFPTMTANSRTHLITRLLELSDPSTPLTATHLLRLKATLDTWLEPNALGHTDDLMRLLRRHDSNSRTRIYIGSEVFNPGFDRVDFTPNTAPNPEFRAAPSALRTPRTIYMQGEVQSLLIQQGFDVLPVTKAQGAALTRDFLCTHPSSDNLYYVVTRWADASSLKFEMSPPQYLSDAWFRRRRDWPQDTVMTPIINASAEGRLVKIVAGIQWTPSTPPMVYFIKFGSLKPAITRPRPPRQKRPRLSD
ncbi:MULTISPECIES: dermonecrotic toxin domain-containing protein [Pseudomonas]|uniref:Dermonecrotic toxin N-terminal domain-containing protein n=1 Tax=Pseudomonas reactans TaxID=117680 RepID=A0A7Y8KGZ1_9PSED|nr:DUF6543 domain-containing protein [Pseudomonas reactans]NWE87565.1 hypothetical protein [Pseudomonas reactans]